MIKVDEKVAQGTLTELEGKVANWLLHTGYYAEKGFSDVEVIDVADGINVEVNRTKGIISSLIKKGYIEVDYQDDIDLNIVYAKDKLYELDNDSTRWEN